VGPLLSGPALLCPPLPPGVLPWRMSVDETGGEWRLRQCLLSFFVAVALRLAFWFVLSQIVSCFLALECLSEFFLCFTPDRESIF